MERQEPLYYRRKKRADRIRRLVSFLLITLAAVVVGVIPALLLINLIFRTGHPQQGIREQDQKLARLEKQRQKAPPPKVVLPEPQWEIKKLDETIPLVVEVPKVAVSPLDERGMPIGGDLPTPAVRSGAGRPPVVIERPSEEGSRPPRQEKTPAQREVERTTTPEMAPPPKQEKKPTKPPRGSSSQQSSPQKQSQSNTSQRAGQGEQEKPRAFVLRTMGTTNRKQAEKQLAVARQIGFNAHLAKDEEQGQTLYVVEIEERFLSYEAAKAAKQRLKEAGISVVIFYPRS